jgi:peptidoglycan/xylan/chitin deacetylase (PgdA/CDA1 family)
VTQKLARNLGFAAAVVAAAGFGLRKLQLNTEGLRNAFDPKYWKDRSVGEDEYIPRTAYFKRGPRDRMEVTLTLDDGPHGKCTEDELAELKSAGVTATFFVVGKKMRQYPDLVREMIADGMEVGNHTETHPRLDTLKLDGAKKEIIECGLDFEKITGRRMTLFRPPGMHENDPILQVAKDLGYHTVGWNVAAQDFTPSKKDKGVTKEYLDSLKATPDQISDRVTSHVKNGAIILLHDQPVTAAALPKIISTLKEAGYTFVSCSQALAHIDHPVTIVADPVLPEKVAVKAATAAPGETR